MKWYVPNFYPIPVYQFIHSICKSLRCKYNYRHIDYISSLENEGFLVDYISYQLMKYAVNNILKTTNDNTIKNCIQREKSTDVRNFLFHIFFVTGRLF